MIKNAWLFVSFLLISSIIACNLYAEGATSAADRMKSWNQHVKLKEESIFKDVPW